MKFHFKCVLAVLIFELIFVALPYSLGKRQIETTIGDFKMIPKVLSADSYEEKKDLPSRLIIPSIGVDTPIEQVGITPEGTMDVPTIPEQAGWFSLGPRPGEIGNSVIAGHFDGRGGGNGVFSNLFKLKEGDKLYVEDDSGIPKTFIVRESKIYNPGYAEEVFSSSEGIHLNLITCDGIWDGNEKSYSKRLVVFTDILE